MNVSGLTFSAIQIAFKSSAYKVLFPLRIALKVALGIPAFCATTTCFSRGLSQKELADLISVSNSRVSNWEQGINRPDADIIASICTAIDVSPSELLGVRLSSDELSDKERKIIQAYRERTGLQHAVDILLGIVCNQS